MLDMLGEANTVALIGLLGGIALGLIDTLQGVTFGRTDFLISFTSSSRNDLVVFLIGLVH